MNRNKNDIYLVTFYTDFRSKFHPNLKTYLGLKIRGISFYKNPVRLCNV